MLPQRKPSRSWPRRALAALGATAGLLGCSHQVGPGTVPVARMAYNEAVVRSWDEQLLLNLVRMRYRDTPLFVDVGSITTQFTLGGDATADLGFSDDGTTTRLAGIGLELDYEEKPTITYKPLQGEDFVTRLLGPITPSTLVLLSRSGWSIETLLICCVQEINGLRNAVAAAGPTPDYVPEFEAFHRLASRLRELQRLDLLRVEEDREGKVLLQLPEDPPPSVAAAVEEVRRLLGVPRNVTELYAVAFRKGRGENELAVSGRSLLAVLFFLSQGVDAPEEDAAAGLVTTTRNPDGSVFDWGRVTNRLLQVRVSGKPPAAAAVSIPYRGHWFWVADDDLTSKSTLSLISFLFSLKAGSQEAKEPLLTLGVN